MRFRFHFIVLCRRKRLPNSGCVDLIYENFAEVKRNYLFSKWNNFYFQIWVDLTEIDLFLHEFTIQMSSQFKWLNLSRFNWDRLVFAWVHNSSIKQNLWHRGTFFPRWNNFYFWMTKFESISLRSACFCMSWQFLHHTRPLTLRYFFLYH